MTKRGSARHQAFYRQEWELRHAQGIELDRTLMCHWQSHLASLPRALWQTAVGAIEVVVGGGEARRRDVAVAGHGSVSNTP